MVELIPSILTVDKQSFERCLLGVKGLVRTVQVDLADGVFVPNKTWAYDNALQAMSMLKGFDVELHFMMQEPLKELPNWAHLARAVRLLLHIETLSNPKEDIEAAKAYGLPVHLVVNPDTPLQTVEAYIPTISGIMLMGVTPGAQGQPFHEETLDRVKELRDKYPFLRIAVDGGVNEYTLPLLVNAGVSAVCPGSAIFGNGKRPEENVAMLGALCKG